jgi:hypothetical protein
MHAGLDYHRAMRWAPVLMGLTVAGCNVTRTVPLTDADSYFDGKIVGRKRAIRAPTKAVYGIRVHAPENGEDAPGGRTYRTEPRSTALAVAGGAFVMAGIGGAIAAGVTGATDEEDPYPRPHLYAGLVVFSLGAGVGAGTAMMAIGGTKVRAPVEATEAELELGAGSAAATVSF